MNLEITGRAEVSPVTSVDSGNGANNTENMDIFAGNGGGAAGMRHDGADTRFEARMKSLRAEDFAKLDGENMATIGAIFGWRDSSTPNIAVPATDDHAAVSHAQAGTVGSLGRASATAIIPTAAVSPNIPTGTVQLCPSPSTVNAENNEVVISFANGLTQSLSPVSQALVSNPDSGSASGSGSASASGGSRPNSRSNSLVSLSQGSSTRTGSHRKSRVKEEKPSYAETKCASLSLWQRLIDDNTTDLYTAQAVILACVVGLGGTYSDNSWLSERQLRCVYSSGDVAKYSGLDLLCSNSAVGLEGPKKAVELRGKERGRALAVIARWILMKKFEALRDEAIKNHELGERGAKWLADFPVANQPFLNTFYDYIDHIEHLERVKNNTGGYKMQKRTWHQRDPPNPNDTSEESRCVISYVRSWYVAQTIRVRRAFFASLKRNLFGVLQKIMLIDSHRDQTSRAGYAFSFKDENPDLGRPEFQRAVLMNIPEMEVSGDDMHKNNMAQFDKVVDTWDRFHITLKYWITVRKVSDDDRIYKRRKPDSLSADQKEFVQVVANNEGEESATQITAGGALCPIVTLCLGIYDDFIENHDDVDKMKIRTSFPPEPTGRVAKERNVSLHEVAIEALMVYSKVKTREDFLGSGKQALRAVHALALGISGISRLAMNRARLPLEEAARGCVGLIAGQEGARISIFNGHAARRVPSFKTGEQEKLFSMSYKEYATEFLEEQYLKGEYQLPGHPVPNLLRRSTAAADHVTAETATTNLDP